ncbi:MAG: phage Gp37/Gp68 family protein [Pseudomonadota bacterium]
MSANTKIEWTDHTFNPWWGCQKVGPGCDHCYAETLDKRTGGEHWGPGAERRRTSVKNWRDPVRWNNQEFWVCEECGERGTDKDLAKTKGLPCHHEMTAPARQRVFCASMADVFDNAVPQQWRTNLFALIHDTPNLDWLLLTKRIGNAAEMLQNDPPEGLNMATLRNVWIGATIVTQAEADRDIPKLLAVPAAKRFLSMEPLLGPVDLPAKGDPLCRCDGCLAMAARYPGDAGLQRIDWVIVGGESGPGARPMHPDWARSLRDQCEAAGVPFLFKQWGDWKPISQMADVEHSALYRSKLKAKPHEDQSVIDDIYGKACTVATTILHNDGSLHDFTEPMAFLQGTGAMQIFNVGKKAAGRPLDGRTWDGFPA